TKGNRSGYVFQNFDLPPGRSVPSRLSPLGPVLDGAAPVVTDRTAFPSRRGRFRILRYLTFEGISTFRNAESPGAPPRAVGRQSSTPFFPGDGTREVGNAWVGPSW